MAVVAFPTLSSSAPAPEVNGWARAGLTTRLALRGRHDGSRHRPCPLRAQSTNSSQFERTTASGNLMYLLVQNRPRRSGALGSDHQKKWPLYRPWSAAGGSRDTEAKALACLSRVAGRQTGVRKLQHFLQHALSGPGKAFRIKREIRTTRSIHHGGRGQSSILIYLHFLRIFKLLAGDAATLEYATISPNLPLYDDSLHTRRTRKWPSSPSSPPVPTGSRSDERAATRARLPKAATTPIDVPARRRPRSIKGWRRTSRPFPVFRPLPTSSTFI